MLLDTKDIIWRRWVLVLNPSTGIKIVVFIYITFTSQAKSKDYSIILRPGSWQQSSRFEPQIGHHFAFFLGGSAVPAAEPNKFIDYWILEDYIYIKNARWAKAWS